MEKIMMGLGEKKGQMHPGQGRLRREKVGQGRAEKRRECNLHDRIGGQARGDASRRKVKEGACNAGQGERVQLFAGAFN